MNRRKGMRRRRRTVRLSDQEWAQLEALARAAGYGDRSAYARDRLLGQPPVAWLERRRELVKAIGRVETLLNQLERLDPEFRSHDFVDRQRVERIRYGLLFTITDRLDGRRRASWES